LAANVLLAVFAPAFPMSLLRQEIRPQPAQAHSLATLWAIRKKEKIPLSYEDNDQKVNVERLMWSLVRSRKKGKTNYNHNDKAVRKLKNDLDTT
jgi:hypothetical protein